MTNDFKFAWEMFICWTISTVSFIILLPDCLHFNELIGKRSIPIEKWWFDGILRRKWLGMIKVSYRKRLTMAASSFFHIFLFWYKCFNLQNCMHWISNLEVLWHIRKFEDYYFTLKSKIPNFSLTVFKLKAF